MCPYTVHHPSQTSYGDFDEIDPERWEKEGKKGRNYVRIHVRRKRGSPSSARDGALRRFLRKQGTSTDAMDRLATRMWGRSWGSPFVRAIPCRRNPIQWRKNSLGVVRPIGIALDEMEGDLIGEQPCRAAWKEHEQGGAARCRTTNRRRAIHSCTRLNMEKGRGTEGRSPQDSMGMPHAFIQPKTSTSSCCS